MPEISLFTLYIVALFAIKHCIADYFLQDIRVYKSLFGIESIDKTTLSDPGASAHAGIHGLGTLLILLHLDVPLFSSFGIAVLDYILHLLTDFSKSTTVKHYSLVSASPHTYVGRHEYRNRIYAFWVITGVDQTIHGLCYLAYIVLI